MDFAQSPNCPRLPNFLGSELSKVGSRPKKMAERAPYLNAR
jgi:hypothetical protein